MRRADVLLLDSTVDAAFSENEVVVAPPEESAVFAAPQLQVVSGRWEPLEPRAVADAGEELQAMGQAEEFVALQQARLSPCFVLCCVLRSAGALHWLRKTTLEAAAQRCNHV